jgi:hypothetical protein
LIEELRNYARRSVAGGLQRSGKKHSMAIRRICIDWRMQADFSAQAALLQRRCDELPTLLATTQQPGASPEWAYFDEAAE